jgi:hypothetical protein
MIYLRNFENEERVRGLEREIELAQLQTAMSLAIKQTIRFH